MEGHCSTGQSPQWAVVPMEEEEEEEEEEKEEEEEEEALISQAYLWNKTLLVSASSSVHHQELASRIRMEHPDPARKLSANLYGIYHCCAHSEKLLMLDRGTVRNV